MEINRATIKNYLPIQAGLALGPMLAAKFLFPQVEVVCQVALALFAVTGSGSLLAGLCGVNLDQKLIVDDEDALDFRIKVSVCAHAGLALVAALYFGPLAALQYAALASASALPMLFLGGAADEASQHLPTWLGGLSPGKRPAYIGADGSRRVVEGNSRPLHARQSDRGLQGHPY